MPGAAEEGEKGVEGWEIKGKRLGDGEGGRRSVGVGKRIAQVGG